jgi:hypothetical protein
MENCTFIAACLEYFGIRGLYDIYIKHGKQPIRVEGKTPEEAERLLFENRSHLIIFADEKNLHHDLGCPVGLDKENIIVYTHYTMETPREKGIAV